ncbi:hypothetical protein B0H14DRAFT_2600638 [Mycena olivaceomarginata]|nr:hypothetical protein B0H14DRAFT_2600638 [Mycena olivaceomarginata]
MTLPQAQSRLQSVLGSGYVPAEWETALEAVMNAEEDALVAEQVVQALMPADFSPVNVSPGVPAPFANDRYLQEAEGELTEVLVQMRDRCCGVAEILEYMKTSGADGDEGEEEEPAEVEFDFDKKAVLAAAEFKGLRR